ncbi:ATP-binding cassette domain-containing protein [Crenobacter caeni]|uniref:ABC transporter ATP-binding protein n=1 Tax=Crenobacter caeni TaxID=2705474 RepID=A0A6B2KR86_9NEIS|nr:ATP-binding cassette domain-containing protein [Crenobacter caeni]NDV12427.1 ABC transporter ATP-binding protein [Crenobacter caeni]
MDALVIRADGFGKRYGKRQAVSDVSLAVRKGELFGLIGPDGAGKSSLMKAVAGVLRYDSGTLEVFGTDMARDAAAESVKARIGLMPQGLGQNLYGDLSVEENVDFFAKLRLVPDAQARARKEKLLGVTRLADFRARPMKQLSGGMKQKLGLVCTLIHAPELIVLDEPTTGVDPVSRRDFWQILAELVAEQGLSALVSTAYMDEASRFARMALMHEGRVLAQGQPHEILALRAGSVVSCVPQEQVRARAALAANYAQVEALGPCLRVFVPGLAREAAESAVARLVDAAGSATAYDSGEAELEDVFVALLAGSLAPTDAGEAAAVPAAPGKASPAIEAISLARRFGDFVAVSDVSFTVREGEIFGLLGANGAGKTTAIKMLTGILPPSSGGGRIAGVDIARVKSRIGYMSQAFSLYLDLTVSENIRLYAGLYGLSRAERAARLDWVLEMAGLQTLADTLAAELPMGQRQRLALGCALVHRPRVLFLDEPTSGVDPVGRRAFWDVLFKLSRVDGVALLVTTHYMSEAEHCDHLALMFAGRIVADATPQAMKVALEHDLGALYEISGEKALAFAPVLAAAGLGGVSVHGRSLHVLCRDGARLAALASEHGGVRVRARVLTMEDVFVERVRALEKEAGR